MRRLLHSTATAVRTTAPQLLLAAASTMAVCTTALAFQFELGPIRGSLNNRLGYGVAWQTSAADPQHIGKANGGTASSVNFDDGHKNFRNNNGTPVTRALTFDSELSANWGNFGAFIAGRYLYDSRNDDPNLHPSRDVRNEIGEKSELLDAYVSALVHLPNTTASVRIGSQRLSWGEAKTLTGGILELNPLNATRFRKPGALLSEVIEPIPMIFGSLDISENVALDAFYQLDWRRTEPDPTGAYHSSNDFAALGGEFIIVGNNGNNPEFATDAQVSRAPDREPSDSNQWGAKLGWYAPQLNGTEFGLYAANYHSRRPLYSGISASGSASTGRYFSEYPEDIQLAALTFNTEDPWFGTAVGAEFTYRRGLPLQVDDVELLLPALGITSQAGPFPGEGQYIQGFRRFNYTQYALNFVKSFVRTPLGGEGLIMLFEAGAAHVHNFPGQDELRFSGPGTYCRGGNDPSPAGVCLQDEGFPTASAWGYRVAASWTYNNVLPGLNIKPKLLFIHDVNGTTPDPLVLFVEHRRQITAGAEFFYGPALSFELQYTDYFGGGQQNTLNDRDLFSASAKYAF